MKITMTAAAFLVLILYILYLQNCSKPKCPPPSPVRTTVVDTNKIIEDFRSSEYVPEPDTIIKPVVRYIHDTAKVPTPVYIWHTVQIPANIDTQAILAAYFEKKHYHDSIVTKYGKVYVDDTVSQNRITSRIWKVNLVTPVVTSTQYPRQLIFGGGLYNSKAELVSALQVDLSYMNRQGKSFGIGIMRVAGQWQKGITFHQVIAKSRR